MIYAQIGNGAVQNIIVIDDETMTPIFSHGFDYFIRIDEIIPRPSINWQYDGIGFIEPAAS